MGTDPGLNDGCDKAPNKLLSNFVLAFSLVCPNKSKRWLSAQKEHGCMRICCAPTRYPTGSLQEQAHLSGTPPGPMIVREGRLYKGKPEANQLDSRIPGL